MTLVLRPRGLALQRESTLVPIDVGTLRFERGKLRDELQIAGETHRIARGRGGDAANLIASARIRPGERRVAHGGPLVEAPEDLHRRWLSGWLEEGEDLLAWLSTGSERSVASPLGAEEQEPAYFAWTSSRSALITFHALGDVRVDPLAGALTIESKLGGDVLRVGDAEWRALRRNEDEYARIAPRFEADPDARRRCVVDLARPADAHREEVLHLLDRMQSEVAALEARLLRAQPVGDVDALLRIEESVGWAEAWEWSMESEEALITAARRAPETRPVARTLHRHLRERRLRRADGQKDPERAQIDADEALAKHLAADGLHEDARTLLRDRMRTLPDADVTELLLGTESDQAEASRVRVLEIEASLMPDPRPTLRELARLQPLEPARLDACEAAGPSPRATRARALFDIDGLATLSPATASEALPVSRPPFDADALSLLRHPMGRSDAVVSWVQSLVAATETPDVAHLAAYSPHLDDPEARAALETCAHALDVKPTAYVSRGDRARGCRAYPGDDGGFLILGGEHLEAESPRHLGPAELRFVIGAELAHLRFGHARATSSEVWRGALQGGLSAVDTLLGALPILQAWKLGKHVGSAIGFLRDDRSQRALRWARKTMERKGRSAEDEKHPDETAAHLGMADLVAAHRIMQLSADRVGLVLSGDPGAAIRGMLRTHVPVVRPVADGVLPEADHTPAVRDLRAWLARRDEEGALVHEELAVRIGALLAFWLSDEFLSLAR